MGGAEALLTGVRAGGWAESGFRGKAVVQRRWLDRMEGAAVPKQFWRAGDRFQLGDGLVAEVLWPESEVNPQRAEDAGLVIRFKYGGSALLYAGDVSQAVERRLLERGGDVKADCLVQGEHSALTNLSRPWLEAVRPRWLIRPGQGYRPDRSLDAVFQSTAERLGVKVLRMQETGAVCFDIGPEKCLISARFGDPALLQDLNRDPHASEVDIEQ